MTSLPSVDAGTAPASWKHFIASKFKPGDDTMTTTPTSAVKSPSTDSVGIFNNSDK